MIQCSPQPISLSSEFSDSQCSPRPMTYSCHHQSASMQASLSEGSLLYINFFIQDKLIPLELQKDAEMCTDRDTMLYIERRKVCGIRMSDCACRSVPYKFTCKTRKKKLILHHEDQSETPQTCSTYYQSSTMTLQ